MFYLIGLGLCDEKDISVRGLEIVKSSSRVYLETYTSILMVQKNRLEAFYGRSLIEADRDMVESDSDEILRDAAAEDVCMLIVGDPFGYSFLCTRSQKLIFGESATTHADILLRARALNVPFQVIHNASIMNAVGACGLQLYNFGQTVSLVFFTDTWKPDSFYDRIKENSDLGLHTLILLDIKVKEQSDENLARGRKIYEPPRYMSVPTAVSQLIEIETLRRSGTLSPATTLVAALSRVGGGIEQRIVCGTLAELAAAQETCFGAPLYSLVIVGKRLHPIEVQFAGAWALKGSKWWDVARTVYKCNLD